MRNKLGNLIGRPIRSYQRDELLPRSETPRYPLNLSTLPLHAPKISPSVILWPHTHTRPLTEKTHHHLIFKPHPPLSRSFSYQKTNTTKMSTRPLIIGPESGPEHPFPYRMEGPVIQGFGRGSKELGIPTANLPVDSSHTPWIADIPSGVYFGWAALRLPKDHPAATTTTTTTTTTSPSSGGGEEEYSIFPMVMSVGYNPFYKNTVRSAEVHVLHAFAADFYGVHMRLLITGFIREEKDYAGLEALIADINFDCEVARQSLARPAWKPKQVAEDGTLDCSWLLRPAEDQETK
ncbi:hypothetical protein QBC47DRAFT_381100 [Echria macrotheca]|uniref:Riboflavin kinase n=1 Tax=Echria macrotheca TaxID=438768 RepID=A0AAJ0BCF7_9PEZI|nr:hypothetical protein QBC47DRAFT_381100 [Echria macrotheca]